VSVLENFRTGGGSVPIFSQQKNRPVVRIPQRASAERAFNKLARTFAAQVETLKRYRAAVSKRCRASFLTGRRPFRPRKIRFARQVIQRLHDRNARLLFFAMN